MPPENHPDTVPQPYPGRGLILLRLLIFWIGKTLIHSAQIMLFVIFQKAGLSFEKFSIPFPNQFGAGWNLDGFPFPFRGEDLPPSRTLSAGSGKIDRRSGWRVPFNNGWNGNSSVPGAPALLRRDAAIRTGLAGSGFSVPVPLSGGRRKPGRKEKVDEESGIILPDCGFSGRSRPVRNRKTPPAESADAENFRCLYPKRSRR